jgi:serine phosphatase RsbU (regulator of sigma subunit)
MCGIIERNAKAATIEVKSASERRIIRALIAEETKHFRPPMTEVQISSQAFQQELLRSEKRRIFGVMAFVAALTLAITIRIVLYRSEMSPWGFVALFLLVAYEIFVLREVNRALAAGKNLPGEHWPLSIILETSFPAIGIAFLASPRLDVAYRPLATPWVLAFFPFLILSVLRLSPRMCRLGGYVATVSYLAAAYYQGWRPNFEDLANHSVTHTAVGFYALILLVSGFIAGGVAGEIRKHVFAALREAEVQRQLEQVQHDLKVARTIQQSLLPKARPNIAGFQIAGWNQPADETGGDFFDWKQFPDGRVVVTMADVTGHGIGSALLASVCRAYARASFNSREGLTTTMQNINQSFGEDLTEGRFATFVAAVCKAGEDKVELLSAGHGPLFVFTAKTGDFQEFRAQALPLGVERELTSDAPMVLDLQPGDLILLITDGFFEWANAADEQFGFERLGAAVRKFSSLPPEEIIAELYQAVLAFANGTKQKDDLTAVIIKRTSAQKTTP